jgi:hypothetical protein
MRKACLSSTLSVLGILAFTLCPASRAQTSAPVSANADIVKMIQAGLPESTVINKIREGMGHWDTSIDALIALKQAGATEAELGTLTLAPTAKDKPNVASTTTSIEKGVSVFGGIVKNDHGDVTFFTPWTDDDFRGGQSTFHVVLIDGQAALRLKGINSAPVCKQEIFGDLIIAKDQTSFNPYAQRRGKNCQNNWIFPENLRPSAYATDQLMPRGHGDYTKGVSLKMDGPAFFFGVAYSNFADSSKERKGHPEWEAFFNLLIKDFSGTMATLLQAAGVTDVTTQLSAESIYNAPSKEEANALFNQFPTYYDSLQKGHAAAIAEYARQRPQEAGSHPQSSGGSANILSMLQGAANLHQAYQNAKVADLTHDTAGQLQAVVDGTTAEMQTLGAVTGDTTTIQPLPPAPSTPVQPMPAQLNPKAAATAPKANGFTYNISHGQAPSTSARSSNVATSVQPKTSPNPGGVPSGVNTGTAAPANCIYLSPSQPCVPLAQMQANQPTRVAVETCPQSGFVPGLMRRTSSDTSEGVPCTPGQPIDPSLFASGGASASGGSGSGSSGGGGSQSSGGADTGGPFDPILNDCIGLSYKNDPITGDHLIIQNNCSVRAQVFYYASSQAYGGVTLNPGEATNTYAAHDKILAAGGVSIYACPVNDIPRQADGTVPYNGTNNHFRCSRK